MSWTILKQKEMTSPTWRIVFSYILLLVLLIFLALLSSCGVRNTGIDLNKSKDVEKEKTTSEGVVSKSSGSSEDSGTSAQTDKIDEKQEQRITELYDENGKLKQRIVELLNTKTTDKSSNTTKSLKTAYINTDSIFNNTVYRTRTITKYVKSKDVVADKSMVGNLGGRWIVLALGVLVIAAVFAYFYLKRK